MAIPSEVDMRKVKALVLSGYGINCEGEMAHGALLGGAEVTTVHAKAWLLGKINLLDYQFLLFPGGFSFGDELGAGKAFANRISFSGLKDELLAFIEKGGCILGVCNGFQILVKLGILPGMGSAALIKNEKGRFESRWVHQNVPPSKSIFTQGLTELYLPIRHGEGNFVARNHKLLQKNGQIALQYTENPNGSILSISGVSDPTGRVLGMMPHPEAALFFTQRPEWIREKEKMKRSNLPLPKEGPGLALFKNAINYLGQL